MTFTERSVNALLGLALGDAYGRTLEFLSGNAVRTRVVDTTALRWTDDTHMSLYVAEAVVEHGPGPFDDDRFGEAIAQAFNRWFDDPLTPSTAPGNTCMAGVRNWRRGKDWRTSGVKDSDGCGAVMRIGPLPMAWSGAELVRAARISSQVTHAHPNALDAAEIGSVLLRAVLEGASLDRGLVEAYIRPGAVGDALRAALDVGFDEAKIPAFDGVGVPPARSASRSQPCWKATTSPQPWSAPRASMATATASRRSRGCSWAPRGWSYPRRGWRGFRTGSGWCRSPRAWRR